MTTWLRAAAAVASGLLLANTYGLAPIWWVAWVAPAPLLLAIRNTRWQVVLALGALSGAVASLSLFGYLTALSGPLPALLITVARAAQWGLLASATHVAHQYLPRLAAAFVFPSLLAGFEVLMPLFSPHGSAGSIAYSQMDAVAVIQLASVGGTPLIAFFLGMVAESLATVIGAGVKHYWTLGALVLLIALGLGYGGFRLASPQTNDGPTVAMIASDKFEGVPSNWEEIWAHYVPAIEVAAAQGATVIVLPEKMFQIESADAPELLDDARELARKHDVTIVFGVDERDEVAWNRAYLVSGEGELVTYDKRHMIPGAESHFSLGSHSVITDAGAFSSGIAICKDLDFPSTIREYGTDGAAALLVPAWDFNEDGWFHSRIAVMRGVENGTSVVRSARRGFLTLSDPYGRILAEAPSGPAINWAGSAPDDEVQTLISQVPNSHQVPTVYTRVGETFGWVALAYGSGALVAAGLTARRQRAASAN